MLKLDCETSNFAEVRLQIWCPRPSAPSWSPPDDAMSPVCRVSRVRGSCQDNVLGIYWGPRYGVVLHWHGDSIVLTTATFTNTAPVCTAHPHVTRGTSCTGHVSRMLHMLHVTCYMLHVTCLCTVFPWLSHVPVGHELEWIDIGSIIFGYLYLHTRHQTAS